MKAQFKNQPLANIKWATERSHKSFSILAGINRPINAGHVTKLSKSLSKVGIVQCIVVSKISFITGKPKFYIIDGQHKFNALIRNNMPIPYIEIEIKDKEELIEKIALLNASSKSWTLLDYVTAWSSLISDYVKLNQYHETYDVDLSFLAGALNDCSGDGGKNTNKIKNGQFRIVNEEECVKFLDCLRDVLSIIPRMNRMQNTYACREFLKFYKSVTKYNHKKVLTALEQNKDKFILATQEEGSFVELLRRICKN